MIRHRFAGLDDSPIPQVAQTQSGLLVVSVDGQGIVSNVELDVKDLQALKVLLEEASQYRQPPQELRKRIGAAFHRLTNRHLPLVEQIIRSFYDENE